MKWTVCLLASLLLAAGQCQVLDIRMHPTPGDTYCGNIQCVANSSLPVIAMTIYDITEKDNAVKLVSISIFAPALSIEQSETRVINATGTISKYKGILGINFTKAADCLYGSFQCELDFVDANGQPDVVKANLIGATEQNGETKTDKILKEVALISDKLNSLLKDVDLLVQVTPLNQDACIKGQPHRNGTMRITLWGGTIALCDTTTDGGGWIIIQRRTNGSVDFFRGWNEYKTGFGNLDTSFWLGNNAIYLLAEQGYNELRIELIYQGRLVYAHYSNFSVDSEALNYRLTVGAFEGTAGDSLTYHNNMSFTTFDRDNDKDNSNCADDYKGAWWFKFCHESNLNGLWGVESNSGMVWFTLTWWAHSVSFSEMKIRRG